MTIAVDVLGPDSDGVERAAEQINQAILRDMPKVDLSEITSFNNLESDTNLCGVQLTYTLHCTVEEEMYFVT